MESRFRVRFWPSRRPKATASELDLHSVPYQTAQGAKQPVFIHQALGRNLTEKRKKDESLSIRTLAYRATKAGKPPLFGGKPHKGNGPVKLQTSRRLSSGEVIVTTQDTQRTIEDIRNSEYIVPGADKRQSRAQSRQSVRSPTVGEQPPAGQSHIEGHSPSKVVSPSTQSAWSTWTGASPLLNIPEDPAYDTGTPMTVASAPEFPTAARAGAGRGSFSQHVTPAEGLGITELQSLPHGVLKSSQVSLFEPHEEENATIRALWKAEYTRLVALYGQSGVDKSMGELKRDHSRTSGTDEARPADDQPFSFALDPLPRPSFDIKSTTMKRRSNCNPHGEGYHAEDTSDEASQKRLSLMSSAEYASSFTTRTSIAESDSFVSKDDIRKVVDDMRNTYIRAIEAREPSIHAVKSLKKKKTRKRKSNPHATPRSSSVLPQTPDSTEKKSGLINSSPSLRSQRSTRTSSQVAGINKLPAIEASPRREHQADVGLKRADSNTLGALMGEHKRASIQKRRSKRHSRRPSIQETKTATSSPFKESRSSAETDAASSIDAQNVHNAVEFLCKDIFRSSTQDFWRSAPDLLSTTIRIRPTNQPSPPTTTPTTPTKQPCVLARPP